MRSIFTLLLALIVCSPGFALEYDAESVDSCINWFEGLRRQKYQWAFGEITNINYFRSKLIRIDDGMKRISQAAAEVKKHCQNQFNLESCIKSQALSYQEIRGLQTHIYLIQTSRSFQEALRISSPNSAKIRSGVEKLISDHQRKLAHLVDSAERAFSRISEIKAKSDFENFLRNQKSAEAAIQLKIVCNLRPAVLQQEFIRFEGARSKAERDPFVLVETDELARALQKDIAEVEIRCGKQSLLGKIRSRVSKYIEQDPYKKLPQVFNRACESVKDKALANICKTKELNQYTIAALHTVLARGEK